MNNFKKVSLGMMQHAIDLHAEQQGLALVIDWKSERVQQKLRRDLTTIYKVRYICLGHKSEEDFRNMRISSLYSL